MKVREVPGQSLDPFGVWNAYVDLLATEAYRDLTPEQRVAHLAFWYESEVQNGGHRQYFENQGTTHLTETVEALGLLRASCHQAVLRESGKKWLSHPRISIETTEDFCHAAIEGEFAELDARFSNCEPGLPTYLEEYLHQHQAAFVRIT